MNTQPLNAQEAWQLYLNNKGEENLLQYCCKGHAVYDLYIGQGIYTDYDLASIFNLEIDVDFQKGLNDLFIHLTQKGLNKLFAKGEWWLFVEEDD